MSRLSPSLTLVIFTLSAKDSLIKCMQETANACPEAPQILRALDLDIPSFQKGVTVLCNHPDGEKVSYRVYVYVYASVWTKVDLGKLQLR